MLIAHLRERLVAARGDSDRRRPFTTLAYAQSIDGSLAAEPGSRLILSSGPALEATHQLRAMHDGILVGVDTVIADDPRLDVRLADGPSPQPIVLDSRLRIPFESVLVRSHRPWIATTRRANAAARRALVARGIEVIEVAETASGWVDLHALGDELFRRGIRALMVEGGERTIASFLSAQQVDYVALTLSPQMIGGLTLGRSGLPRHLRPQIRDLRVAQLGEDLMVGGRLQFESPGAADGGR